MRQAERVFAPTLIQLAQRTDRPPQPDQRESRMGPDPRQDVQHPPDFRLEPRDLFRRPRLLRQTEFHLGVYRADRQRDAPHQLPPAE
ncbi:hypothetical protein D3C76_1488170 [compost metagenome]